MKKFIVPIILAAALGVGGGVAAVVLNRQADAEPPIVTELECGTYYLNGDKNSDLWMEVNPEFLIVKGTDVDNSLKTAIAVELHGLDPASTPDENTAKIMQEEFDDCKTLYCTEKIYIVEPFIPEKSKSRIKVSRDNTETDRESLTYSNAAFVYNYAENTISTGLFGDFILVE